MRIGINASFLRKRGTGIGQVTWHFLKTVATTPEYAEHSFVLYLDDAVDTSDWPKNFETKVFLPWWKRDDVLRKWLWEKKLGAVARKDGCQAFLSLYQSATRFPVEVRHVMVVHDVIPEIYPAYRRKLSQKIHWGAVKKSIQGAERIVAVSKSTRADAVRMLNIPEGKITVAYPAANPFYQKVVTSEKREAVLAKYHLTSGYIYHGGGLEIRKNTEAVLRAYARLKAGERHDQGVPVPPLVISGKIHAASNELATDVTRLIRDFKLESAVTLLGFVPDEDMPALYRGARMFVYPSLYEGFGLPVLEALTVGVPVVASGVSSLPEVGGEALLYVDPKNAEELSAAMKRLLFDEELRQELVSKSRTQALQFSWRDFTEKVMHDLLA